MPSYVETMNETQLPRPSWTSFYINIKSNQIPTTVNIMTPSGDLETVAAVSMQQKT